MSGPPRRQILFAFAALVMVLFVLTSSSARRSAHVPQVGADRRPTPTPKPKPAASRPTPRPVTRSSSRPPATQPTTPARQAAPQIEMVLIPAGTFTMGSPESERGRNSNEGPQHQVTVQSFYIGKYEVTQAQWQQVMGTHPSVYIPSDHNENDLPVPVSWNEAKEFIRKLNLIKDRYVYRLPTEAEWEYACRAGTTTEFYFGGSLSFDQANFDGRWPYGGVGRMTYRGETTPVGSFRPNAFGLYDMHGNLWEWCEDWYHENYDGAPADGSVWASSQGDSRVIRGGAYNSEGHALRSASRVGVHTDTTNGLLGFRLVATSRTL